MGVVVIGCGQAGFTTVTSLRERGYAGEVTMVMNGEQLPYQRPPLSKAYLKQAVPTDELVFRPREHYERHGITLVRGPVTEIDRERGRVHLAQGGPLAYEHLVLATGARPRRLGVPGEDLARVVQLHDADDAGSLLGHLDEMGEAGGRLVVIGAGFIGMEVAASARARGTEVTVLEFCDRVMQRSASPVISARVLAAHRAAGTTVVLGTKVSSLLGGEDGRVRAVVTADGQEHPADLVVTGVGALPSTELADRAGLVVDRGIVVDEHLVSVGDPAVSAIGDCCVFPLADQGPVRLESVQNATDQARHVAARLAGEPAGQAPYAALPWFWTEQLGLKVQIAGLPSAAQEHVAVGDPEGERFSVLGFHEGRLVAVESVNQPAEHMAARRLLGAGASRTVTRDDVGPGFSLRSFLKAA